MRTGALYVESQLTRTDRRSRRPSPLALGRRRSLSLGLIVLATINHSWLALTRFKRFARPPRRALSVRYWETLDIAHRCRRAAAIGEIDSSLGAFLPRARFW